MLSGWVCAMSLAELPRHLHCHLLILLLLLWLRWRLRNPRVMLFQEFPRVGGHARALVEMGEGEDVEFVILEYVSFELGKGENVQVIVATANAQTETRAPGSGEAQVEAKPPISVTHASDEASQAGDN